MANLAAPMPSFSTPFLKDGLVNDPWYRYLFQLQLRGGGAGQMPDINALQAQANYNTAHVDYQSVVPTDPAISAAARGVEDLWGQQRPLEDVSALWNRIAELESILPPIQDFMPILQRLNDLEAMLADVKPVQPTVLEQWNAPTLLNSWVNKGSPVNPTGYWKDPFGVVHLRGVVKSGTVGQAIFTLPIGYRPANDELYAVVSNDVFGSCNVTSAGNVVAYTGSNVYFCMDGITFRTAN